METTILDLGRLGFRLLGFGISSGGLRVWDVV